MIYSTNGQHHNGRPYYYWLQPIIEISQVHPRTVSVVSVEFELEPYCSGLLG